MVGRMGRAVSRAIDDATPAFALGVHPLFFGSEQGINLHQRLFPTISELEHLALQQKEVAFRQQMQVSLEG